MSEGIHPISIPGEVLSLEEVNKFDHPYSDEEIEAFDREADKDQQYETGFDGTDPEAAEEETPLATI